MGDARHAQFAGPGIMLISAALFGYFGFASTFNPTGINGQFLLYVPILEWTLKISAVAFLVCAGLSIVAPLPANLLFSVVGLLGAILFVIVAVIDFMDKQHTVMHPFILLIFAAWNGYGSWQGLRSVLAVVVGQRSATSQVL